MMVQMASSNTLIQSMVPRRAARPRDGRLLDDVRRHRPARRARRRRRSRERIGAPLTVAAGGVLTILGVDRVRDPAAGAARRSAAS